MGLFQKGGAIVMLHCAFQAIKKSIEAYVTRAGGSVIMVHLPFPVSSQMKKSLLTAEFRKGLARGKANGKKVRLAIIDHITSMPYVVIPACELVKICRLEGVEHVFVDAAHAIGSILVDVKEIGADFYVNSAWFGTRDYSSQPVVPNVLEFINRFEGGLEGIQKKNRNAVVEMGEMLAKAWGTNLSSPPEMCPSMAMIGLPSRLGVLSDDDALKLRTHLRDHFGLEVPIHSHMPRYEETRVAHGDGTITGYAQISHQVYNTLDDYVRLRDVINQLLSDGLVCKMLKKE
ncbi:L-cysteine desulfhydrase [Olea europaea subsp. europaea]|uniref:L-cysteine desulfhydrase n=1 Tax=Olea europaea subsp. europaea TaxID=158383 RepID=A0A8S0PPI2_OLEEU|nr:L-cysteine desulfhydrase [Olea europaea subsp. europaea]